MPGTSRVLIPVCFEKTTTGIQTAPDGRAYASLFGSDALDTTYQATVEGTGAVTATVQIEVSNDLKGWLVDAIATLALTGTNVATAGFTSSANWMYVRANITAITGTGAKVTVTIGG